MPKKRKTGQNLATWMGNFQNDTGALCFGSIGVPAGWSKARREGVFVNVASWIEIVGKGIRVEVGEGEITGCGGGTVSNGCVGVAVKVGVKTPGIVGEIRGVIGVQVAEGAAVWEPVGVAVIELDASGVSEGVCDPGVIDPVGETVIVWVALRVPLEVRLGVRVAVSCCK